MADPAELTGSHEAVSEQLIAAVNSVYLGAAESPHLKGVAGEEMDRVSLLTTQETSGVADDGYPGGKSAYSHLEIGCKIDPQSEAFSLSVMSQPNILTQKSHTEYHVRMLDGNPVIVESHPAINKLRILALGDSDYESTAKRVTTHLKTTGAALTQPTPVHRSSRRTLSSIGEITTVRRIQGRRHASPSLPAEEIGLHVSEQEPTIIL